jgi:hypothetical protein
MAALRDAGTNLHVYSSTVPAVFRTMSILSVRQKYAANAESLKLCLVPIVTTWSWGRLGRRMIARRSRVVHLVVEGGSVVLAATHGAVVTVPAAGSSLTALSHVKEATCASFGIRHLIDGHAR